MRGILLDTTTDSPARSSWLSIKQHNGYCGYPVCTEPGKQLDLGPGKKIQEGSAIFTHSILKWPNPLDMPKKELMMK